LLAPAGLAKPLKRLHFYLAGHNLGSWNEPEQNLADMRIIDAESEDLTRPSRAALAERRARGEIMTYVRDGWVFREYPGQRMEHICLLEDYRAADHPTAG